jgi:hypothetical protein
VQEALAAWQGKAWEPVEPLAARDIRPTLRRLDNTPDDLEKTLAIAQKRR